MFPIGLNGQLTKNDGLIIIWDVLFDPALHNC